MSQSSLMMLAAVLSGVVVIGVLAVGAYLLHFLFKRPGHAAQPAAFAAAASPHPSFIPAYGSPDASFPPGFSPAFAPMPVSPALLAPLPSSFDMSARSPDATMPLVALAFSERVSPPATVSLGAEPPRRVRACCERDAHERRRRIRCAAVDEGAASTSCPPSHGHAATACARSRALDSGAPDDVNGAPAERLTASPAHAPNPSAE